MEGETCPSDPAEMRQLIVALRQQLKEKDQELIEFQEASQQLEEELEADLKQKEKTIASLKRELDGSQKQLARKNTELKEITMRNVEQQENLSQLRSECSRLGDYVRELEQFNDDLERRTRQLDASLADFETKLHQQIERNVYLENELGEKEQLEVTVQRLKDEARDLKGEIAVQQTSQTVAQNRRNSQVSDGKKPSLPPTPTSVNFNGSPLSGAQLNGSLNHSTHLLSRTSISSPPQSPSATVVNGTSNGFTNGYATTTTTSPPFSPVKTEANGSHRNSLTNNNHVCGNNHLSSSTRLSALNIVSDLLRKVGALESKLATCSSASANGQSKTGSANQPLNVKSVRNSTES